MKENKMSETLTTVIDPVCGMALDRDAAVVVIHAGASYHFCDVACADTFRDEPERWLRGRDRDPFEHAHH